MLTFLVGAKGSGKSLHAIDLMGLAALQGRPVYSNIELTPVCPFAHRVARIDTPDWPVIRGKPGDKDYLCFWHYILPGSMVVIDEINLYMDAMDFKEMGRDAHQFHQQARKLHIDCVYIVHHMENVWVRLRRLGDHFVFCEHNYRTMRIFRSLPLSMSRFLRSSFSTADARSGSHTGDGYYTYKEASVIFPWYQTDQILGSTNIYRGIFDGNGFSSSVGGVAGEGRAGAAGGAGPADSTKAA